MAQLEASRVLAHYHLKPAGNISHAPAVAELIRAYFGDVMGRRQQPSLQQ